MSKHHSKSGANYTADARRAIADPALQQALAFIQKAIGKPAIPAYRRFPEGAALRQMGRRIRQRAIGQLDELLARMADRVRANGGHVHFAADAEQAVSVCLSIARRHGVRRVVKGKSMVTEEIGLNPALTAAGIDAVETDLGEYIVQLAGERPSHIIAPAIHKNRRQIADLFVDRLGIAPTTDPETLTRAARRALRERFLAADMGISGCNLACAETGHIALVSNEGNVRLATTLPRVHVAFMGMERIVERLTDHNVILRLLTTAAAAQRMACYLSYIGAPRSTAEADGPEAFHLVVLDNGRRRILNDPEFREMLTCIRCAACLNICPVYGKIGGHAYGHPYSGPMGAVLMPLLYGLENYRDLYHGETLCGACKAQCPVDIDLPRMLRTLRARSVERERRGGGRHSMALSRRMEGWGWAAWRQVVTRPAFYDLSLRAGRLALAPESGAARRLPGPLAAWSRQRDLPTPARRRFLQWWQGHQDDCAATGGSSVRLGSPVDRMPPADGGSAESRPSNRKPEDLWGRLTRAAAEVNLQVSRFADPAAAADALALLARQRSPEWGGAKSVVAWHHPLVAAMGLPAVLKTDDIALHEAPMPTNGRGVPKESRLAWRRNAAQAFIGVTGADACLADTATLVLRTGPGRPRLASLLPTIHVAVLPARRLVADLGTLLAGIDTDDALGPDGLTGCMSLITGPSRTRDIEAVMVYGAHGPREVHLFVIAES